MRSLEAIKSSISSQPIAVVQLLAENCAFCQKLKDALPGLEAKLPFHTLPVSEETGPWIAQFAPESVPYTLVFDNGQFVGGESFDFNQLQELVKMLEAKHGLA